MHNINELFPEGIHSVGIAGHVNPDGDCVGSCSALYLYIRKNFPEISVDLYLEKPKAVLMQIPGASDAKNEAEEDKQYDLFIICDVSSMERIGVAGDLFQKASHTACIDHHVSNTGLAEVNEIAPKASSCAEVLCGLLTDELIDVDIAQALYTGMIHDSGVFQYRNTSPATLRCAAALLEKGFDATAIIEQTFNQRTFVQNRITGFALETAELFCGDR
ncbi:MAG: DHH family phosphoesterase, partial [Lachnospiraceae bacterium]|nr:DHH family phosphoesterase [Lachnospiraceae bacterium]